MVSVTQLLTDAGAMLEGHFQLSSGLHSPRYLQCALALQYPELAARLGTLLADQFRHGRVDVVIAPALGGILIAHEVARSVGARAIFAERQGAAMTLRRGFALRPGERVLAVEDVVTTGRSLGEVIALVGHAGAELIGVGAIVDRSLTPITFGAPFRALLRLPIPTYEPRECPLCQAGMAVTTPGSRYLIADPPPCPDASRRP